MDVLGSVHLGVQVYDRGSTGETAIGSDLRGTNPVIGATGSWGFGKAGNVCLDRHVLRRYLKLDCRVLFDGLHHALDTCNNHTGVGFVLKVGCFADIDVESTVD